MSKFGDIYLSWRKGKGHSRHLVGVIKHNATEGVYFRYFEAEKLKKATLDGFQNYTEFPDLNKTYTEGVIDIFKQRLFKSERSDYQDFLDFWNIPIKFKDDTLHILAHTQGLVPTDNFEFLADFNATKDLKFVSEIAGLTYTKVNSNALELEQELIWKKNPTTHDEFQVDIYSKDNILLGQVKKVHSKVFYSKHGGSLKIKVKSLEKNGFLKRCFIGITTK
jgi:hypothetical protein